MKHLLLIIFFCLSFINSFSQPNFDQCYFSHKKGLIYSDKLLVIPIDSLNFLIEYYSYGGGVFSGLPYSDTLTRIGNKLSSKKNELIIGEKRLIIKTKEGKRKFKYVVLGRCDSIVNHTRNWSFRENLRYKIKDQEKARVFEKKTNELISKTCFEKFRFLAEEIFNNLN